MQVSTIGLDLAKHVFQVHGIDAITWPRRSCLRMTTFSSGGIVLVALDVGLHVLGRHQPYLVSELPQHPSPMVRRGARLHAHQARRQRLEERHTPISVWQA